jgi:hypothetical protein
MAALSEQIAGEPSSGSADDRIYGQLLSHTRELSGAMKSFLGGKPKESDPAAKRKQQQHAAHESGVWKREALANDFGDLTTSSMLALKLVAAATRCRGRRLELSLLLMEPNVYDMHSDPHAELASHQARRALGGACAALDEDHITLLSLSEQRTAAIISNCDRRAALAVAQNAISELAKLVSPRSEHAGELATTLSIGVASASVVPKNFDAMRMIERATRCLSAARACGISTVKSIEV